MPAVQCDQCDHCFPVPASYAAEKVVCPRCRAKVRVAAPVTHPALNSLSRGASLLRWAAIILIPFAVVGGILWLFAEWASTYRV